MVVLRTVAIAVAAVLVLTTAADAAGVKEIAVKNLSERTAEKDNTVAVIEYEVQVTFDSTPNKEDEKRAEAVFKWAASPLSARRQLTSDVFLSYTKIEPVKGKSNVLSQGFRAVSGNITPFSVSKIKVAASTASERVFEIHQATGGSADEIEAVLHMLEEVVKKQHGFTAVRTLRERRDAAGIVRAYIRDASPKK